MPNSPQDPTPLPARQSLLKKTALGVLSVSAVALLLTVGATLFQTSSATLSEQLAIFIDSLGKVGIGTKTPTTELEVAGTVKATAFQGDGSGLTGLPRSSAKNQVNLIAGTALAGATTPVPVYLHPGGLILEQATSESGAKIYGIYRKAQTFQSDRGTTAIQKVALKLQKVGSPKGQIAVQIWPVDEKQQPTGSPLAATKNILADSITDGWNEFEFKGLTVEPSTTYALVVSVPYGESADHLKWQQASSNVYAGGSTHTCANYFNSWSAEPEKDFAFRLYSHGRVYPCVASAVESLTCLGFATTDAQPGESVTVQTSGIVGGFTDLVVGAKYYVQDAAGTIGEAPGSHQKLVGMSVSPQELSVVWEEKGEKGDKGDRGEKGDKGDPGNTGPAGSQGSQGPQGIQGEKGNTGNRGPAGASPFILNGSNVYYNNGNVGIGTASPTARLDVNGLVRVGRYTSANLPNCNANTLGAFSFDITEDKPYVCTAASGGTWKPLDSDYDKDGIVDWNDQNDTDPSVKHVNLIPENINKGVDIFGVTGTFTGGLGMDNKTVLIDLSGFNFYRQGRASTEEILGSHSSKQHSTEDNHYFLVTVSSFSHYWKNYYDTNRWEGTALVGVYNKTNQEKFFLKKNFSINSSGYLEWVYTPDIVKIYNNEIYFIKFIYEPVKKRNENNQPYYAVGTKKYVWVVFNMSTKTFGSMQAGSFSPCDGKVCSDPNNSPLYIDGRLWTQKLDWFVENAKGGNWVYFHYYRMFMQTQL